MTSRPGPPTRSDYTLDAPIQAKPAPRNKSHSSLLRKIRVFNEAVVRLTPCRPNHAGTRWRAVYGFLRMTVRWPSSFPYQLGGT